MWIGTGNFTLSCFDAKTKKFTHFQPELPPNTENDPAKAGLLGEVIGDCSSDSILYIGSRFGVYHFNKKNKTFKLFSFEKNIIYLYKMFSIPLHMDCYGTIWSGSLNDGLKSLDTKRGIWKSWIKREGVSTAFDANLVLDLFPLSENVLLALTRKDGIWEIDLKNQEVDFTVIDKYPKYNRNINGGYKDKNGDLWLAQATLLQMTKKQLPFTNWRLYPHFIDEKKGKLFKNNWQRSYCLSQDGQLLYMGTYRGDGLLILDWENKTIKPIRYKSSHIRAEYDVLMDDLCFDQSGRLWVGSDEGLLYYDEGATKLEKYKFHSVDTASFSNFHISSIAYYDGALILGTSQNGIFYLNLSSNKLEAFNLNETFVKSLLPDYRIKKVFISEEGLLWIGCVEGLFCYSIADSKFFPLLDFKNSGPFLKSIHVTGIGQGPNGSIWIGTFGSGLLQFNPRNKRFDWHRYTINESENKIYKQYFDKDNILWLGIWDGILRFDPVNKIFSHYEPKDGLDYHGHKAPFVQLPDGKLINGGNRAFHYWHPDTLAQYGRKAEPYFKEIRVFDKPLNLEKHINYLQKVDLKHNQNQFSIEYGAFNFNLLPRNAFKYQLKGYDENWINGGKRQYVSYTNLPPGQYSFCLKVMNKFGQWSENTRSIDINIKPAFYQTNLFRIIMAAFVAVIIYLIYYFRIRQIKNAEHLKTEFHKQLNDKEMSALRAQMNPHFLFNSLNSINWYIIKKKPRQASRYLTKFSRLMRLVLENSKSKKIPLEHELQALKLYMEMEALRFENKFNYEIIISENIDEEEVEVPPLILQPYVENAIWHGLMNKKGKGNLSINISEKNNQLHCSIEDNGIGREAAAELKKATVSQNRSRGMEITSSRISMMKNGVGAGQSVQIIDLKDGEGKALGTRVELLLPLH